MSADEARALLDSLLKADGVVDELRFSIDTLEVLDRLAQDDIAYARRLAERLKQSG